MKRIDRWVGRHMSPRRWIVAWSLDAAASLFVVIECQTLAVRIVLAVNAAIAVFMVWGNARRVR